MVRLGNRNLLNNGFTQVLIRCSVLLIFRIEKHTRGSKNGRNYNQNIQRDSTEIEKH